jgi:hypothetical protein
MLQRRIFQEIQYRFFNLNYEQFYENLSKTFLFLVLFFCFVLFLCVLHDRFEIADLSIIFRCSGH